MKKPGIAGLIIILSAGIIASANSEITAGRHLVIEQEWMGAYGGSKDSAQFVLRTEDEWITVWAAINRLKLPQPNLPVIDFEKTMLVAVFLEEKRHGGWKVVIKNVIRYDNEIVVEIDTSTPSPDSVTTMTLEQPYHIVAIQKHTLPVRFNWL